MRRGSNRRPWLAAALLSTTVFSCAAGQKTAGEGEGPTEYSLYYLGGQSNMDGYGKTDELPVAWADAVSGVMIFTGKIVPDNETGGGAGIWEVLQPGHGLGFDTDGETNKLSHRFGPELSFGRRMAELKPGKPIAIIKYSKGGTALQQGASGYGNWEPDFEDGAGINQYDHALATFRNALSQRDIDGDGRDDTLIPAGIVWMQGEADAWHSQEAAEAYRENLERMMNLLRAALRADDLPVVIGKITDSGQADDGTVMDYIGIVQQAQRDFTENDHCATLVTVTEGMGYQEDGWHYDTDGFLRMGAAFADAVHALEADCLR